MTEREWVPLQREHGRYRMEWGDDLDALLEFDLVRSGRDGEVTAEVTASNTQPTYGEVVAVSRVNLVSARSRTEFANHLAKHDEHVDWRELVEYACRQVVVAFRAGQASILLRDAKQPEDAGLLLPPLLVGRMPTILFGDGGAAKSYVALAAGLSVHTGQPFLGLEPVTRRRVGILDYEMDAWEHRRRMEALVGDGEMPDIAYIPCAHPLADDVDRLQRAIRKYELEYLIVDSVGLACGGPPEAAEIANRFYGGLRELGLGALLVAHVNRSGDTERPFGSAFWSNSARMTWYVKREQSIGAGAVNVALFNKKANTGPLQAPIGFRFSFDAGRTYVTRTDVRDIQDIAAHVPVRFRIESEVRVGALTYVELASALDVPIDTIKKAVDRDLKTDRPTFARVPGEDGVYRIGLAA